MSRLRTSSILIVTTVFLSAASAFAQSPPTNNGTPCTTCGTKIDNNIKIDIDLKGLTDTFNKVVDALVLLGLKPTYVNGNYYFNNGIINNGNWNSGTMNNSLQNKGIYNTGNNNMIKLLAGNGGGGGGGFAACGNGAVCGRRW